MEQKVEVLRADITQLEVDFVVNAATKTLLGGGGVDGAIHRAAGPELLEYCRGLPEGEPGVRCPTGEAVLTPAFGLGARAIIHTVGPVWHGGHRGEPGLLGSCYEKCLRLAHSASEGTALPGATTFRPGGANREQGAHIEGMTAAGAETIAFPAISCGVYRFPHEKAAAIAVRTVRAILPECTTIERVILVAFSSELEATLRLALDEALKGD